VGKIARHDFAHADRTERRNVSGEIAMRSTRGQRRAILCPMTPSVFRAFAHPTLLAYALTFACAMNARQPPKAEQSTRCCRPRA